MLQLAPPARVWAGESPKEIVERFYRFSAGKNGKWEGPSAFNNAAMRKSNFSKALLQAVASADARNRKGELGWLDFDPISNSQDPSVKGLRVSVVSDTAAKTTIRADFRAEENPKSTAYRVDYDFVLEGTSWKLDDIRNPIGDRWSIRKLAKEATAAPKR
ncbi:MAG: DUF3828 domain-containing protein [Acetobacteraceae bacterium]|nr:DUF3828 domain-containing protein [Acetobacteraceae bacterium]